MKKCDAIIIGAGNGGLITGINLLNKGYSVLIVEQHNNVGGFSNPIKKGRFYFEPSFQSLYIDGDDNHLSVPFILKELDIPEVEFTKMKKNIMVYATGEENKKSFELPLDKDKFIETVIKLVPESEQSIKEFMKLAQECDRALNYINENANVSNEFVEKHYPEFYDIGNASLSKILDKINMPLEAQEIINSLWIYLGSPEGDISFAHYASFIYNLLNNGIKVPKNGSHEISLALFNKYLELGGKIRFNHQVVKIITEDGMVRGVRMVDGKIYYSDYVISSMGEDIVYRNLIDEAELPSLALKSLSKREIGGRPLTIYLGLNRSVKTLGLDKSIYLLYETFDSDFEFTKMKQESNNLIATVWNNFNEECSPKGTCMLSLTTSYFDDCFGNFLYIDNYDKMISNIVNNLINKFEDITGVHVKEFIEEIDIRTPVDNALVSFLPDGSTYGYRYVGYDNIIPRILNRKKEKYVDHLYFCGGFDGDIYGLESTFAVANRISLDIIKRNRGVKNGKR